MIQNRNHILLIYYLMFALLVLLIGSGGCVFHHSVPARTWPDAATGKKVEVIQSSEGSFRLLKGGEPFFIKGIAGRARLDVAAQYGANTIRTWSTAGLDTLLDRADSLGMVVMAGLNVVPGRLGLDYRDQAMVKEQLARLKKDVLRYKDHPALLMWIVGNEPDLMYEDPVLWTALDEVAAMIKEVDPDHPTTIAMQGTHRSVSKLAQYCPNVDLLSINIFLHLPELPQLLQRKDWGWKGPYIVTEWSNRGYWERVTTDWDAPVEQSSGEKEKVFLQAYEQGVLGDPDRCLGSCVFYWGFKQERTQTWFSLFSANGEKTSRVDAMYKLWADKWPENRVPEVTRIEVAGETIPRGFYATEGEIITFSVVASDPESDSLTYHWELRPEGNYRSSFGGDAEQIPAPLVENVLNNGQDFCKIRMPVDPGPYRLFVYVRDGQGNLGAANLPLYISRKAPF